MEWVSIPHVVKSMRSFDLNSFNVRQYLNIQCRHAVLFVQFDAGI